MRDFYTDVLQSRFDTIARATQYAHILNEISINNQNIIISLMTVQTAYISAIETGLTISYEQPYWQTYANFQKQTNKSALSEESFMSVEKSFQSYALSTARGWYVAKALASKNTELVNQLPINIKNFLLQSSNEFVNCLALEFQNTDLYASHYTRFFVPKFYQFGVTKQNCSLHHKTNVLQTLMRKGLPTLSSNEPNLIIEWNKIDEYFSIGNNSNYGITYVDPIFAREFMDAIKFNTSHKLKTTIRISHPEFMCQNQISFTIEEDWQTPCDILPNHFIKSFFKPNWAALVTFQEKSLKYE